MKNDDIIYQNLVVKKIHKIIQRNLVVDNMSKMS